MLKIIVKLRTITIRITRISMLIRIIAMLKTPGIRRIIRKIKETA